MSSSRHGSVVVGSVCSAVVIVLEACGASPEADASRRPAAAPIRIVSPSSGQVAPTAQAAKVASSRVEVPMHYDGGVLTVPVMVNGAISLRFLIDSGASDVSVPSDVVSTLIRSGTIDNSDFIGTQTFVLADGSTVPSAEFRIRSMQIGTLILHNVTASLADAKAPLLLGQSFLKRLSGWSIDNGRGVLVLTSNANGEAPATVVAPVETSRSDGESNVVTSERHVEGADGGDSPGGRAALARTMEYFATSSISMAPDVLVEFYAPNVVYFGRPETRENILKAKMAFATRWPSRSYIPRSNGSQVTCAAPEKCIVTGLVDWQATNTTDRRNSAGTASYEFVFDHGLLVGETSHVLSRELNVQPHS